MKKNHITLIGCLLFSLISLNAQDIKFAGTHPPDQKVVQLFNNYGKAITSWKTVAERDSLRKSMVSAGYFYHGHDGAPIDFAGLTERQAGNDLKLIEARYFDVVLHQYENSALVTFKHYTKGTNGGETFAHYGSAMMVMGKEKGVWKVMSDMTGRAPAVVKDPAADSKEKTKN